MKPKAAFRLARWTLVPLLALVLAACGSDEGDGFGRSGPDYERALAGAPPPLAALHEQANQLLGGGTEAFAARLERLRGHPVVVNKWASWCGPCRSEFPYFQDLAAKYGKRVAFLGVDSDDDADAAATFLSEFPVPYPSYSDPGQEIAATFNAGIGFPATAFYDRGGDIVHLKLGEYFSRADLEAEIRRYALGSG